MPHARLSMPSLHDSITNDRLVGHDRVEKRLGGKCKGKEFSWITMLRSNFRKDILRQVRYCYNCYFLSTSGFLALAYRILCGTLSTFLC